MSWYQCKFACVQNDIIIIRHTAIVTFDRLVVMTMAVSGRHRCYANCVDRRHYLHDEVDLEVPGDGFSRRFLSDVRPDIQHPTCAKKISK